MNGSVNGNMFIIVDTPLVDGLRSSKNPKKNNNNVQECSFYSLPPSLLFPPSPSLSYQAMISVVQLLIF